jgi:hypothetical protein
MLFGAEEIAFHGGAADKPFFGILIALKRTGAGRDPLHEIVLGPFREWASAEEAGNNRVNGHAVVEAEPGDGQAVISVQCEPPNCFAIVHRTGSMASHSFRARGLRKDFEAGIPWLSVQ